MMPSFDLIPLLLLVVTLFYAITFIILLNGMSKGLRTPLAPTLPFVSVIVAARNEEKHLSRLLNCLLNQQYSMYEVIIVDDRSSDGTADIVRQTQGVHKNLKFVQVATEDSGMPPKKNALTRGIEASRGEILVFTDADCLPPPTWLAALISGFGERTGMVAGYSPYRYEPFGIDPQSLWQKFFHAFIRYEELKMSLWAAGSIGVGLGWLCTGRNLAYRRTVWDEVSGFEQIRHSVSGDDDLFLQLIRRTTAWKIRYVASSASQVPTAPPETFAEFVQQRIRHFSAGRFFSPSLKLFFVFFHCCNVILYASFALSFFAPGFAWGPGMFLVKVLTDLIFVTLGSRQFGAHPPLFSFVFMEFALLWYNMIIGPLGMLGSFRWKPDPP